jgi:hypothetical protein
MTARGAKRNLSAPVPPWWMERVRVFVAAARISHAELAVSLTRAVGRRKPWVQSDVSRFLNGTKTPGELADAFQRYFALPPHVVYPRDLAEALVVSRSLHAHRQTANPAHAGGDADFTSEPHEAAALGAEE